MIDHTATAPASPAPTPLPPAFLPVRPPAHPIACARREARLSRLRLYSYCLTLGACVLALMSFMYLTQGTADGNSTFLWLGATFVVSTALTLWLAVRVTQVGEFAT